MTSGAFVACRFRFHSERRTPPKHRNFPVYAHQRPSDYNVFTTSWVYSTLFIMTVRCITHRWVSNSPPTRSAPDRLPYTRERRVGSTQRTAPARTPTSMNQQPGGTKYMMPVSKPETAASKSYGTIRAIQRDDLCHRLGHHNS